MRWRKVEPALSSRGCLDRGLIRARVSSARDYSDGHLPVWHCFHGVRALRLDLWLCCDSATSQREEPRLWQALAGSQGRYSVVTGWLSGIAEAKGMVLWLTILPCAGSRGRFGDDWIPMSMSVGTEAEGAARASAGVCSMLNQK
eukprot:scaffold2651_cov118-Isochrysis_galbana.AAC.5